MQDLSVHNRVFKVHPITTNIAEGRNRYLNILFDQPIPSLTKFLMVLRTAEHINNLKIRKSILTLFERAILKTDEKLLKLRNICVHFEKYIEIDYLVVIASFYSWKFE